MLNRLSNSWELFKESLKVLAADKELVVFPIISTIGLVIVTLTFAAPLFLSRMFDGMIFRGNFEAAGFIVLFLFYVVQYTVIFFANTALVGAAMIRLRGGDPTVGDGIRIATSRFLPILGFALVAATVGMILRAISSRSHGLGRLIVSIIGFAWNVATYLVVPVLAVENVGPFEAIKRSAGLLKRTWGEQIAGNLGLGAIFVLAYLAEAIVFVPLFILAISTQSGAFIVATIALLVLAIALTALIQSTLEGIYSAAVYQYATTGQVSGFFNESLVRAAFSPARA
jgi:hypothetical protein